MRERISRTLALAGLSIAVVALAGCDTDTAKSGPEKTFPRDIAIVKVDRRIHPIEPRLSEGQKRRIYRLARRDPALQEILRGRQPYLKTAGYWSGSQGGELLGAGIVIRFRKPGDYFMERWPHMENVSELYGVTENEGSVVVKKPVAGARPVIGTAPVTAKDVKGVDVLYDLKARRVAEVIPMGGGL